MFFDIPGLVQEDACDLGIVGQNVIAEKRFGLPDGGASLAEVMVLDFGRCRLSIAVPDEARYEGIESIRGRRVATSYPRVLGRWLAERGLEAEIVTQNGALEIAPRLGRADMICDLVSTGATLAANGQCCLPEVRKRYMKLRGGT